MPDTTSDKSSSGTDIRQKIRAQRRALTQSTQQQHSQALRQVTTKEKFYRNSQHIGCYLANDGEIDPWLLVEHALCLNKKVYLPILSRFKDSLYFAPYDETSRLQANRFNIPEPVCHPSQWKTAAQLDLLLIPLVAFDPYGNRIGMGGGFYDRTLAYLQHRKFWRKPRLVGLAHEIQKVAQLQNQSWDIPLDYIITEKQRYRAKTPV